MPGFGIEFKFDFSRFATIPSNKTEFYRSHRWEILNPGFLVSFDKPLYAKSVKLPTLKFEEFKIKSGASLEYKIIKKASWQDVVIKFYDTYGLYKNFKAWQDRMWNPQAGVKKADDYKSTVVISLTDGSGNVRQRYTMVGAYPKSVDHGELSYDKSEVKLLSVTYSYDYAKVEFIEEL